MSSAGFLSAKWYAPFLLRLGALVFLYSVELIVISIWLDNDALAGRSGLSGFSHDWGAWILRSIVGFAGLFATCAFLTNRPLLQTISRDLTGLPVRAKFLWLHVAALLLFGSLSVVLYRPGDSGQFGNQLAMAWFASGFAAIFFGAISFVPLASWKLLLTGTLSLWWQVLIAVAAACVGGYATRFLWSLAAHATFLLSRFLLNPFLAGLESDSAKLSIGTARFSVEIAKECSGLEGIGLILAFTVLWLVIFRREFRFPHALLLIPAGVAIMFFLNSLRIAALVAIGNAGAERIALGGFHSQAGWIAFNAIALSIAFGARKIPWLVTSTAPMKRRVNYTGVFLVPLLTILATGMLATALSAGFEWFYPIRFFAASGALWFYRRHYNSLGWRCTWVGPSAGLIVFVIWLVLDRSAYSAMPTALSAASAGLRGIWILFRVLAAVITVPLAEELAFRGFLYRRLIAEEFEIVPPTRFAWSALIVSSLLFGVLHGDRWFAGTLAGAVYAIAFIRKGRIADAVLAHATTNALLAAYVLLTGKWQYW